MSRLVPLRWRPPSAVRLINDRVFDVALEIVTICFSQFTRDCRERRNRHSDHDEDEQHAKQCQDRLDEIRQISAVVNRIKTVAIHIKSGHAGILSWVRTGTGEFIGVEDA